MQIRYREATEADAPRIAQSRASDAESGPADPRIAAYLVGRHHPQHALPPRAMFIALNADSIAGFIAGHLTRRYGCDGELQYLYVVPEQRRRGIATQLLRLLVRWFGEQRASKICVDVSPDNWAGRAFYAKHRARALNRAWMVWDDIGSAVALESPLEE